MTEKVGGINYKNGNGLTYGAKYDESINKQDNSTEIFMVEGEKMKQILWQKKYSK